MTAIAGVEAVHLTCPHCDEPYNAPNGSNMFLPEEVPKDRIKCGNCNKTARVPKTVRIKE